MSPPTLKTSKGVAVVVDTNKKATGPVADALRKAAEGVKR